MRKRSKKIQKADEESKKFIIYLLANDETHGIDIDSIYFTRNGWIIFEFLKCDTVDPYDSHPNRYPFNWRKFATLFELSKKLEGKLILINYSKKEEWKNHIKMMHVKGINYDNVKNLSRNELNHYISYLETEDKTMNLDEFKNYFKNLNNDAIEPWE